MKNYFLLFGLVVFCCFNVQQLQAQTITVCYTGSSGDYAINSSWRNSADDKLTNPANFGPSGSCPYTINVVELSTISAAGIAAAGCHIIDLGIDETSGGSGTYTGFYTSAELAALKAWSDASINNVIIAYQAYANPLSDGTYIGIGTGNTNPNSFTTLGMSIFDGAFGATVPFNQGGSYQGIFSSFDANDNAMVETATGNPTGFLDCSNGNIYLADVDLVTIQGGLTGSNSPTITSNTDVFWGNLICGLADLVIYGTGTEACSFDFGCDFADANADCDGDGVLNGVDSDSGDPCLPVQAEGYTGYDSGNSTWAAADCDSDGDINAAELTAGSDPYCSTSTVANPISCLDPCDPDPNALACPTGDFDGDGIANDTDTDPSDPCIPVQTEGYTGFDISNAIWIAADCDNDGDTNGAEVTAGSSPYCDLSTISNPSGTCICGAGTVPPNFGN